jgi:recA bacterial DNA recombination protein
VTERPPSLGLSTKCGSRKIGAGKPRLQIGCGPRLGKNQKAVEIEILPTGSLGLDIALGVGGLPRGRVVEIYGPESSEDDADSACDRMIEPLPKARSICESGVERLGLVHVGTFHEAKIRLDPPTRWCGRARMTCWSSTRLRP